MTKGEKPMYKTQHRKQKIEQQDTTQKTKDRATRHYTEN